MITSSLNLKCKKCNVFPTFFAIFFISETASAEASVPEDQWCLVFLLRSIITSIISIDSMLYMQDFNLFIHLFVTYFVGKTEILCLRLKVRFSCLQKRWKLTC